MTDKSLSAGEIAAATLLLCLAIGAVIGLATYKASSSSGRDDPASVAVIESASPCAKSTLERALRPANNGSSRAAPITIGEVEDAETACASGTPLLERQREALKVAEDQKP